MGTTLRALRWSLPLLFASSCSRMGDRPPWWKVDYPPVKPALLCLSPQPPPNTHARKLTPAETANAEMIQRNVRRQYAVLRYCYEVTLFTDPFAQAKISTRFVIEPSGRVSRACISSYDLPDGQLLECVVNTIKGIRFDQVEKKTTVVYPVFFQPAPRE